MLGSGLYLQIVDFYASQEAVRAQAYNAFMKVIEALLDATKSTKKLINQHFFLGSSYLITLEDARPHQVIELASTLRDLLAVHNQEQPEVVIRLNIAIFKDDFDRVQKEVFLFFLSNALIEFSNRIWHMKRDPCAMVATQDFFEHLQKEGGLSTEALQQWVNSPILGQQQGKARIWDRYGLLGQDPGNITYNPEAPVSLIRINLTHFRGALKLDLALHPRLNVFAGVNGSGKSTLLEAVARQLSWLVNRIKSPNAPGQPMSEDDISNGKNWAAIAISCNHDGQSLDWVLAKSKTKNAITSQLAKVSAFAREISRSSQTKAALNLPLFVYYPVNRAVLDIPLRVRKKHEFHTLSAYEEALAGGADFRTFFEWFRDREDMENDNRQYIDHLVKPEGYQFPDPQLQAIRLALSILMPELANLKVRRKPKLRLVVEKEGQLFAVNQLSDGEKCLMAMVCDLARRLAIANPSRENPLLGHGTVLIDELDLHLHPKWQHRIIPKLLEVFPNCQFLISTHSPHVLTHVPTESLFLLKQTGKGLVVEQPNESYGKTANRILEDLMGLETTRPDRIEQSLRDISDAIHDNQYDLARERIDRLRSEIGEDPELVKAGVMVRRKELLGK